MKIINTGQAPAAIGPYSQAIVYQGLLYSSGQIALSPSTGQLIGETAKEQAEQCLKNLDHVLRAGGAKPSTILKVVIFLINMEDFTAVNEVYQSWIGDHRPARSTVAVRGLPRGALVEIECIAHQV
jgi:2-iminobutanoate/2-iminopropanoate deaminase